MTSLTDCSKPREAPIGAPNHARETCRDFTQSPATSLQRRDSSEKEQDKLSDVQLGAEDSSNSLDCWEMAAGGQNVYRKENSHFLSLLAIGAVLLTIFFLFVGTSHHSTPYIDGSLEHPPVMTRRQSLEVRACQSIFWLPVLIRSAGKCV